MNFGPTHGCDLRVIVVGMGVGNGAVESGELFEQIRPDRRDEGLSIRQLMGRHGVHRRTVRQALELATPPSRVRRSTRTCRLLTRWLSEDRDVPRKQRHTAGRVWQQLIAEHGASLSAVTVSRYVARRRVELGLDEVGMSVPQ